jgi:hypothetical protein
MKTRNSLVSNSSSSSFVVAYKSQDKCKCCGRSDPDLKSIIQKCDEYSGSNTVHASGKTEVIEFLKRDMGDSTPDMDELFNKIKQLDDSYSVIFCSVDQNNDVLIDMINSTGIVLFGGDY